MSEMSCVQFSSDLDFLESSKLIISLVGLRLAPLGFSVLLTVFLTTGLSAFAGDRGPTVYHVPHRMVVFSSTR